MISRSASLGPTDNQLDHREGVRDNIQNVSKKKVVYNIKCK